jgi:hypothetical protein
MEMGMVTFRIPQELRKEMDHIKINWSAYIRQSISAVVDSQKKQRFIHTFHRLRVPPHRPPTPGTAAAIIRQMREHG